MTEAPRHLIVISYYDRRPVEPLRDLFASMQRLDPGLPCHLCVVVNRDTRGPLQLSLSCPDLRILERPNRGMNIGAWDYGWRSSPAYEGYLFLQDECYPVQPGWLSAFESRASDPGVGLVGEYFNDKWRLPWEQLRVLWAGHHMKEHSIRGKAANRVDVYLDFLARHRLPTGTNAGHMRSLVWYAKRAVLEQIGGFPIGKDYGECIAAEIAVSKQVEALGLEVVQVAKEPFSYVRHAEWVVNPATRRFVHI